MQAQEIIRRGSVDEIVAHRARILDGYRTSLSLLSSAIETHGKLLPGHGGILIEIQHGRIGRDIEDAMRRVRRTVDRAIWRHLLDATGLRDLMDAQALAAFERSLDRDPPEATKGNLVATFTQLAEQSEAIFRRGLVNAFCRADHRYRSNDPFRLGRRLILTYVYDMRGARPHLGSSSRQVIKDLDRIFHLLDGREPKSHLADAGQRVFETKPPGAAECTYFEVRLFLNGNAHVVFTRPDLVEKANQLLADHFGAQLAHDDRPP